MATKFARSFDDDTGVPLLPDEVLPQITTCDGVGVGVI
jgi:hypothetical protein